MKKRQFYKKDFKLCQKNFIKLERNILNEVDTTNPITLIVYNNTNIKYNLIHIQGGHNNHTRKKLNDYGIHKPNKYKIITTYIGHNWIIRPVDITGFLGISSPELYIQSYPSQDTYKTIPFTIQPPLINNFYFQQEDTTQEYNDVFLFMINNSPDNSLSYSTSSAKDIVGLSIPTQPKDYQCFRKMFMKNYSLKIKKRMKDNSSIISSSELQIEKANKKINELKHYIQLTQNTIQQCSVKNEHYSSCINAIHNINI
tara:strand:+ start:2818 stop:3585 length:768 start_codon:yes stop_codon:yes gene_type:complete